MKRLPLIVLLLCANLFFARSQDTAAAALSISGDVPNAVKLSIADLTALPTVKVQARDRDKEMHEFEGVEMNVVLSKAGIPFEEGMKGKAQASKYFTARGADGFFAVFALLEVDPTFTTDKTIVAWRRDGNPLDAENGPLRVIVPSETRHARWVRQLDAIIVETAK